MPDAHYIIPRLAEIYDLDSPWSTDRDFYLSLAGPQRLRILDLGCGTGLLCNAYASKGHHVTGIDPAAAMLDIARRKSCGGQIEWIQSFAQTYHSGKQFDLITMTGNAFQVLLSDLDILATLAMVRKHLSPAGRFVFESRNPAIDWATEWNYDLTFNLPEGDVHESRRFLAVDGDRMRFELHYRFSDARFVSASEIRFLKPNEIARHLEVSGLLVHEMLGGYNGERFHDASSHEMIFIARRASFPGEP